MYANYHTHTERCGHAHGQDEEFIQAAIDAGLTILGFSDHAPWQFPNGFESDYRVKTAQRADYFSSLQALREKYADRLEMHIGFEMEYYPLYFPDMLEQARRAGCEYLILGQHAICNEMPDKLMSQKGYDDPAYLRIYVQEVCEAMHTGKYTYVCHPEVFKFFGPEAKYLEEMRPICVTARETGTPLEINFLGMREHLHYPRESFWAMAAEEHADVILGADAHMPENLHDTASRTVAEEWVRKYGLHLLHEAELRKL